MPGHLRSTRTNGGVGGRVEAQQVEVRQGAQGQGFAPDTRPLGGLAVREGGKLIQEVIKLVELLVNFAVKLVQVIIRIVRLDDQGIGFDEGFRDAIIEADVPADRLQITQHIGIKGQSFAVVIYVCQPEIISNQGRACAPDGGEQLGTGNFIARFHGQKILATGGGEQGEEAE